MQLAPYPPSPVAADGGLASALGAGRLGSAPDAVAPRRGRLRRWMYAAAAGEDLAVGAAVVDAGLAGTAFAWVVADGELAGWEVLRPLARGCVVARDGARGASFRGDDAVVVIGADGGMRVDVPTADRGRLRVAVRAGSVVPAVLTTPTREGGWNATEKAAGYRITGRVVLGGTTHALDGGGWRDWTVGRQDRHTSWRWAAGAGRGVDANVTVGLNVSTGMNAEGAGEDVVWWDGVPHGLTVEDLAPEGEPDGPWVVRGPGWSLRFHPAAVRAATEGFGPLRSSYVQPVGRFTGRLPGPDGAAVPVELTGVTESHVARW